VFPKYFQNKEKQDKAVQFVSVYIYEQNSRGTRWNLGQGRPCTWKQIVVK